jgi:hypothetical protein
VCLVCLSSEKSAVVLPSCHASTRASATSAPSDCSTRRVRCARQA